MKKLYSMFLALILVLGCAVSVYAEDNSRSFLFELSVDGSDTKQVETGDIITVVFQLMRTDAQERYDMYAMQNEICYDDDFFTLLEDSAILGKGISSTDLQMRDSTRAFYMNFVSMTGGETWNAKTLVGSFRLKVTGTSGSSTISSRNYQVSTRNGEDNFAAQTQDVTVTVSTQCTVQFETNGGSALKPAMVERGSKVSRPADPVKTGFKLSGWYQDIDLQQEWDFDRDTVAGNMTLYAKWTELQTGAVTEQNSFPWWLIVIGAAAIALCLWLVLFAGRKTVRFSTGCKDKIQSQRVRIHGFAICPREPVRPGRTFAGWYTDRAGTKQWIFAVDKVEENMTLYAKWV